MLQKLGDVFPAVGLIFYFLYFTSEVYFYLFINRILKMNFCPESRGELWPQLQRPRPHASPRRQRQPPRDSVRRGDRSRSQQQLLRRGSGVRQQGGRYRHTDRKSPEALTWRSRLRSSVCVVKTGACWPANPALRYQSPGRPADRQPGGHRLQQALPGQRHLQLQVTNSSINVLPFKARHYRQNT